MNYRGNNLYMLKLVKVKNLHLKIGKNKTVCMQDKKLTLILTLRMILAITKTKKKIRFIIVVAVFLENILVKLKY